MNTHHKNGTTLRIHLELLCNIQRVETVYRNNLATVKQKFDRPDRNPRARLMSWKVQDNLTRREVETRLYDVIPRRHMNPLYLDTFTKALEQSGLKVPNLTLREPKEIQMMPGTMSSLQSLRRLELDFEDAGHETFESELNLIYDDLVGYIGSFPDLEELSITMPESLICLRFMKIENLLPDLTVPKLRSLSLKRSGELTPHSNFSSKSTGIRSKASASQSPGSRWKNGRDSALKSNHSFGRRRVRLCC